MVAQSTLLNRPLSLFLLLLVTMMIISFAFTTTANSVYVTWSRPTISKSDTSITTQLNLELESLGLSQPIVQFKLYNPPSNLVPGSLSASVTATSKNGATLNLPIPFSTPITDVAELTFNAGSEIVASIALTFSSPLSAGRLPFLVSVLSSAASGSVVVTYPYPGSSILNLKPEPLVHLLSSGSSGVETKVMRITLTVFPSSYIAVLPPRVHVPWCRRLGLEAQTSFLPRIKPV